MIGSTVSGKKVEVDTGRDLHIQSLQDVDNFKEHSKSDGFSISSKPNFKDQTGSISASVGRIDSKWKSVTHQAGIYAGEDGYDKIYNSIGLVPNLGVGSKGKESSTTQSAISDGILIVDGKEIDTKTINTNTENTLHQLDKIFDKKKIEERQELARLFAKNAFEEVHRLSDKYHWKEGGPEKVALHAAIGEITAQLAGNPNGSGAMSAGINQLAIKKIIDKVGRKHPDQAQLISAALGSIVNKVTNQPGITGGAVASNATKWNDTSYEPQYEGVYKVEDGYLYQIVFGKWRLLGTKAGLEFGAKFWVPRNDGSGLGDWYIRGDDINYPDEYMEASITGTIIAPFRDPEGRPYGIYTTELRGPHVGNYINKAGKAYLQAATLSISGNPTLYDIENASTEEEQKKGVVELVKDLFSRNKEMIKGQYKP